MIIWLAELLQPYFSFFRLFEYLSFRAIASILTALSLSLWMGPRLIERLQMLQIGQVVRNDGPESHFSKRGTPCLLYTSPSPRDSFRSRMPSSA